MPYLTGFVVYPHVPEPVSIEFWDRATGTKLVEHALQRTAGTPYQFYFPDDYFVKHLDDLDILFTDEIDSHLEIVPRFGDRNPLKIW